MKKKQLILIGIGILAVVALASLPKIVVDNEDQANISEGQVSETTQQATDPAAMHEAELSPEKEAELTALQISFNAEPTAENARALASLYQEKSLYDSAAFYLDQVAATTEDQSLIEDTGNAYYEAFTFALDPEKVAYLADQTRNYLNRVLENDPSRTDLKSKIAMTYVSSSNPMQGIAMLREILDQDPQNEDALFNMGILSMQSGQYKRATERFEELINYHPENLQGQFYLGVSYFEANQKNKAKSQFEKTQKMTQDPMILETIQGYLDRL